MGSPARFTRHSNRCFYNFCVSLTGWLTCGTVTWREQRKERFTYFPLGPDRLCLALIELTDALTPPQNEAHPRVADTHDHDGHEVSEYRETNVVPARTVII